MAVRCSAGAVVGVWASKIEVWEECQKMHGSVEHVGTAPGAELHRGAYRGWEGFAGIKCVVSSLAMSRIARW